MAKEKNQKHQQVGNQTTNGKPLKEPENPSDFSANMDKHPCVSKNLKLIMNERKLTIQAVSKLCKLPRSTVHNVLVGREISMKTADKLRKGLCVSLAYLVYGEEESSSKPHHQANDLLSGLFEVVIRRHNPNQD